MKIVLLARNPKLYSHQRLMQAARDRGHEIDHVKTLRATINIASRRPSLFLDGKKLEGYDAVIPRIGASVTFYGLAVLRQFEMMGVYPLNESVAIGRSRDKLRSMRRIAKGPCALPPGQLVWKSWFMRAGEELRLVRLKDIKIKPLPHHGYRVPSDR